MTTLSVVRGGVIGVTAVAAPSVALGITTAFIVGGLKPFGLLGVTVVLVGGLAWTCVRVAHFQPRLAVFLTTFPFGVLLLLTLGALVRGNGGASCSVSVNSRSQYASRGLPPGWPCNELAINTANQMARRELIRRPNQLIKRDGPIPKTSLACLPRHPAVA